MRRPSRFEEISASIAVTGLLIFAFCGATVMMSIVIGAML